MIHNHPDEAMLVEYVAGALSLAPSIAVTTHLQFCQACGEGVQSLNHLGGELLDTGPNETVSDDLLQGVLLKLDTSDSAPERAKRDDSRAMDHQYEQLPLYIRQLLPDEPLQWSFLSPSLRHSAISVGEDSYELALHRIKAGGKAPEHDHSGQEITVVLTGCFSDDDGLYQPGDFIVREPGEVHRPLASQNEECICLSVLAAPIKLTGLKRVVNPFLTFNPC